MHRTEAPYKKREIVSACAGHRKVECRVRHLAVAVGPLIGLRAARPLALRTILRVGCWSTVHVGAQCGCAVEFHDGEVGPRGSRTRLETKLIEGGSVDRFRESIPSFLFAWYKI